MSASLVDLLSLLRWLLFVLDGPVKSKAATVNFIEESMTAASNMFADATQVQYTTVDSPCLIQDCHLKADEIWRLSGRRVSTLARERNP